MLQLLSFERNRNIDTNPLFGFYLPVDKYRCC